MTFRFSSKSIRRIALVIATILNLEIFLPAVAFALTSGPSQPEFSSFEPVASTEMVDEFSGDFTYNLPLMSVPGPQGSSYPINLAYHSGASSEEEASWVGYGWTLNPGAINRNTRGFPDDYNNADITYHNKMPANWTATIGTGPGLEGASFDLALPTVNGSLRYNNYTGFGYNFGAGVFLGKGTVNVGFNLNNGQSSFSGSVSPLGLFKELKSSFASNKTPTETQAIITPGVKDKFTLKNLKKALKPNLKNSSFNVLGGSNSIFSFGEMVRPQNTQSYRGNAINVSVGTEWNPFPVPAGVTYNAMGSFAIQDPTSDETLKAFGYMYTSKASNEENIQDYYLEKESPYSKRDNYIGIPFNNADNFIVSGEGVGGGFRLYHQEIGEFRPNSKASNTAIENVGVGELSFGLSSGIGLDLGAGWQRAVETNWDWIHNHSFSDVDNDKVDEPVFFRFNNDLGGNWGDNLSDNPEAAPLEANSSGGFYPDLSNIPTRNQIGGKRGARSAYIGYRTNKGITDNNNFYSFYSKNIPLVNRIQNVVKDGLGELAVFSENGSRYVYGLPVYSRNEKNLQFGVQGVSAGDIDNNYLVYSNKEDVKVGEERNTPYASMYLLTEITTPDYVDRTMNGPSPDDFGGYTQFIYEKVYGNGIASDNWFKWRVPYNGLAYQRNSLSDGLDDMGSVAEGEKEIYYLKAIRTKTHTAFFSTQNRADGKEATKNVSQARTSRNAIGANPLRKLTQIDLYSNASVEPVPLTAQSPTVFKPKDNAVAIKTVKFQYAPNNSALCQGAPNAGTNVGKLTLSRVWFEYNGISEAKISPYIFEYAYPDYTQYPSEFQNLGSGYNTYKNDPNSENPKYDAFNLDAWGNYQKDGANRFRFLKTWLNQVPNYSNFDPAAWQLKVIKLPTGGQIHVQYEQDDYSYVQNKNAHVMVSLKPPTSGMVKNRQFILNTAEIGITSSAEIQELKSLIEREYLGADKKIYFKFLYNLYGINPPDLDKCNVDYISGYVTLSTVTMDGGNIVLNVGNTNDQYTIPENVCRNFVETQRGGKLTLGGNCDPSQSGISKRNKSGIEIVKQLTGFLGTTFVPEFTCLTMNPELSYFKIPFSGSKKGGGIRVKRLLTFDKGFDNQPVLYGNEYIYQFADEKLNGKIRSSGVATNEPGSIREENALVGFMPRKGQSLASKIISGIDRKQFEGPIGETILPGPSVGYRQVIIKNIHSGKTNPGFSKKEFYTSYDYPSIVLNPTPLETKSFFVPPLPLGLVNVFINHIWTSQGFSFVQNNMNGQPRQVATYSGDFSSLTSLSNAVPVSSETYEYFEPGSTIPVMSKDGGSIENIKVGREADITMANKMVKDDLYDISLEGDINVNWVFPPIITAIAGIPSITTTSSKMYSHAISKIIRYPSILKKVTSMQDGITHVNENIAFDKFTGKPIAVRSFDEFKGGYLKYDTKASWAYENMRGKAENEGKVLSISNGKLPASSTTASTSQVNVVNNSGYFLEFPQLTASNCDAIGTFRKGDMLSISVGSNIKYVMQADAPDLAGNRIRLYPIPSISGQISTGNVSKVVIIQSGNKNQLNALAGTTTYHNQNLSSLDISTITNINQGGSSYFVSTLNHYLINAPSHQNFTMGSEQDPFLNMNMSAYAHLLPADCRSKAKDLTVTEMVFYKEVVAGKVLLGLKSFKCDCGAGTPIPINY